MIYSSINAFNLRKFPPNNSGNFCERMTNGCNVPVVFLKFGIAREYARLFKESCNRHDICYICVSTRQFSIK